LKVLKVRKSQDIMTFWRLTLRLVKYNKQNKGVWGMPVALRGEEGRDKLRKAAGIGTYELIRRYPNGATRYVEDIPHR
jgi:hypothetical protein